jgi:hypothetical protein
MLFNVKPSDVVVNVSDTTRGSTELDSVASRIFGSVGPLNLARGRVGVLPHIQLSAEIAVGALSPQTLARIDWSFGYIQAISLGSFFMVYSGAKSNAGSVTMQIMDDTGRVFPDFDHAPPTAGLLCPGPGRAPPASPLLPRRERSNARRRTVRPSSSRHRSATRPRPPTTSWSS